MDNWLRALIAIGIIALLLGVFILSYILNKRTPKPEGCEEIDKECATCSIDSCAFNKNEKLKEGIK
ncbi:MAG: hypothetical protein LKE36_07235 [Bacilli bacterium]|jgi:sugar phosphate permease|nr:hypothetical protein [Bacilli bacterium]MCH4201402.1 hypothetical protein [Bacilli bacterium]